KKHSSTARYSFRSSHHLDGYLLRAVCRQAAEFGWRVAGPVHLGGSAEPGPRNRVTGQRFTGLGGERGVEERFLELRGVGGRDDPQGSSTKRTHSSGPSGLARCKVG